MLSVQKGRHRVDKTEKTEWQDTIKLYGQIIQMYGMSEHMSLLSEILSSKVRAEVFRLLFGLDDNALHVREIERRSGFAIGTIQTEMKKLYKLNLVLKKRDGNRLYYRANRQHPIFSDIHAFVWHSKQYALLGGY